jgi:hypothetical protein
MMEISSIPNVSINLATHHAFSGFAQSFKEYSSLQGLALVLKFHLFDLFIHNQISLVDLSCCLNAWQGMIWESKIILLRGF